MPRLPGPYSTAERAVLAVLIAVAGGVVGFAVAEATAPEPEVRTVTETVVEIEKVTPKSCIVALDASEKVLRAAAQLLAVSGTAIAAAGDLNLDRTLDLTERLEKLESEMTRPVRAWTAASEKCRDTA